MADERAVIEILAEFQQALSDFRQFESKFREAVSGMDAAAEGVDFDRADESARRLETDARDALRGMESSAERAATAVRLIERSTDLSSDSTKRLRGEVSRLEGSIARARAGFAKFAASSQASIKGAFRGIASLRTALISVTALVASLGIGRLVSQVVEATERQALAVRAVEQAIEATGGAAGLTSKELQQMAKDLQAVTNYGDEVLLQAQAQLLTFKSIGEKVFPRVLESALDLSTLFKQDLRSSVIQLGKAIEDPVKGLSALSRVGITFSEEQEKQIKGLVKQNKLFEAQGVLLGVLEGQLGGQARAAREAGLQSEALKNTAGDLLEKVGEGGLLDAIRDLNLELIKLGESDDAEKTFRRVGAFAGFLVRTLPLVGRLIKANVIDLFPALSQTIVALSARAAQEILSLLDKIPGVSSLISDQVIADVTRAAEVSQQKATKSVESILAAYRDIASGGQEAFERLQADLDGTADSASRAAAAIPPVGDESDKAGDGLSKLADSASDASDSLPAVGDAAEQITDPLESAASATADLEARLAELRETSTSLADQPILTPEQLSQLHQAEDAAKRVALELERARQDASRGVEVFGPELTRGDVEQKITESTDALHDLTEEFRKLDDSAAGATPELKRLDDGTLQLKNTSGDAAITIREFADGTFGLYNAAGLAETGIGNLTEAIDRAKTKLAESKDAAADNATSLKEQTEALKEQREELQRAEDDWKRFHATVQHGLEQEVALANDLKRCLESL